jgi:O-Antigen ligase/Tetratricopeptide repeat
MSRLGWEGVVLGAVGLGCGLSPFWNGLYQFPTWGAIALGALMAVVALVVARPLLPGRDAALVLLGLTGLAAWSWISTGWAESAANATTATNRLLLYLAFFAALILLLRTRTQAIALLGGSAGGVLAVGVYVVARMAFGSGETLFLESRLNEPLGYINGQANAFLLGFWPLIAVAERRHPLWSGAACAGATLLACLMLLTQARGVPLGLAASTLVLFAFVPGRRVRAWVLLTVLAAVVAAGAPLLDVYQARTPGNEVIRDAAGWIILVTVAAGLGWAIACAITRRVEKGGAARRGRAACDVALVFIALVALVAGTASAGRIADRVQDQWNAFVSLRTDAESTRLLTGGGYRYDYWRIAWREFRDEPLHGVGAGNYRVDYFFHRRTVANITQPHSIELQVLAELGIVGGLALAVLAGGVALGFARRARLSGRDRWAQGTAVAAGGTFAAWFAHTSVDWLHLIPGLTGTALGAMAVLVMRADTAAHRAPVRGPLAVAVIGTVGIAAALAAIHVGRPLVAHHLRVNGKQILAADPRGALDQFEDALSLDDEDVTTYQLRAAAFARLDDYARARASLLEATEREPSNFVTWALLGDLASRRGSAALARHYYRRALTLNPRDATLAGLARRPTGG